MRAARGLGMLALAAAGSAACAQSPPVPCHLPGVEHGALCGQLRRALDPARPQGVQIDVHYAVLPALALNKRPDPVLFFAGGPGQSAIELAGPIRAMLARFANRRDVVLVDLRGTGRSAPLRCGDEDADDLPLAESVDPARRAQRLAGCRERLQALPYGDLRFFTTPLAVADADAVRAALGAPQVNLVGVSYGTRAALEYLRQFAPRVRRAVLDGVAPPDLGLPVSAVADAQAALESLFTACEQEAACSARHPALRAAWQGLLAGLPRSVTLRHPFTGRAETVVLDTEAVRTMIRPALYAPALAAGLPYAIGEAVAGRWEPLAGLAQALGGGRGMAAGLHFSVVCAEDAPALATATPEATGGYAEICRGWPRAELPPAFYRVPRAEAPVLLLSGGLDPATPPRHAARVAQALGPQARQVTVAQAGHGVLSTACMRDVLYRFIDAADGAAALQVDAGCAAAIPRPPFFEPPGAVPAP